MAAPVELLTPLGNSQGCVVSMLGPHHAPSLSVRYNLILFACYINLIYLNHQCLSFILFLGLVCTLGGHVNGVY